jgi:hypothetical protein
MISLYTKCYLSSRTTAECMICTTLVRPTMYAPHFHAKLRADRPSESGIHLLVPSDFQSTNSVTQRNLDLVPVEPAKQSANPKRTESLRPSKVPPGKMKTKKLNCRHPRFSRPRERGNGRCIRPRPCGARRRLLALRRGRTVWEAKKRVRMLVY